MGNPDRALINGLVIDGLKAVVGHENCEVKVAKKPIQKSDILKLSVISKDPIGEFLSDSLKSTSQLVDRYNATFVVTRVFVHPDFAGAATNYLKRIAKPQEKDSSNSRKAS